MIKDYKYLLQEKKVVSNCCPACKESPLVAICSTVGIGLFISCVVIGWMAS